MDFHLQCILLLCSEAELPCKIIFLAKEHAEFFVSTLQKLSGKTVKISSLIQI